MSPAAFEIHEVTPVAGSPDGGSLVLEVVGDVDASNAAHAETRLAEMSRGRSLIVDLSSVQYFDSAAFAMLYRMLGKGDVRVVIPPASTLRMAAELISLPLHDSVAAAEGAAG